MIERNCSLFVFTRGAQAALAGEVVPGLASAPVWGVAKSVSLEHPQVFGAVVDLPGQPLADEVEAVLSEVLHPDSERLLALRPEGRLAPRLRRVGTNRAAESARFRADATYLITGGLGALGMATAAWMIQRGARHLALLSRHEPSAAARDKLEILEQSGANVRVLVADAADESAMRDVLAPFARSSHPLRGVVHAAGVAGEAVQGADAQALQEVLRGKAAGAWVLHELTRSWELDFFVTYSSMVSVWGTTGQAHYVAANHFLDTLAHHRRALGLPALAINWGPWAGTLEEAQVSRARQSGVTPLSTAEGLAALGLLLGGTAPQVAVVRIEWPAFRELYASRGRGGFFEQIPVEEPPAAPPAVRAPGRRSELESAAPATRQPRLTLWLQQQLARILGFEPGQLPDPQRGFFDLGLDSLLSLDLQAQLNRELGVNVRTRVLFDYPTATDLSRFLLQQLGLRPDAAAAPPEPPAPEPESALSETRVAELLEAEVGAWRELA